MPVFSHPEYDAHEHVAFHYDAPSGLRAIIAVHDTHLGPGLGGCRMWPYVNDEAAITDVLRLSRGMTYKAAMADLCQGGGKSVIIGDPRHDKSPGLMRAMGRFVESLGGRYIVAEDSGTNVADIRLMAEETQYVGGLADAAASAAGRTGDPSPATALGVFIGMGATAQAAFNSSDLNGLRVAIQGVGNVGYRLAGHLHSAGARLWVTDLHQPAVDRCVAEFGATPVAMEDIHAQEVDIFAPCAMGAGLNERTIPEIRAKAVAGAANNQLARPRDGHWLAARGILYAPDYVINAGGIIDIHYEGPAYDPQIVHAHLSRIGDTLTQIYERSRSEGRPPGEIANLMAEQRFRRRG
jgi:leucine dehydrogenase